MSDIYILVQKIILRDLNFDNAVYHIVRSKTPLLFQETKDAIQQLIAV